MQSKPSPNESTELVRRLSPPLWLPARAGDSARLAPASSNTRCGLEPDPGHLRPDTPEPARRLVHHPRTAAPRRGAFLRQESTRVDARQQDWCARSPTRSSPACVYQPRNFGRRPPTILTCRDRQVRGPAADHPGVSHEHDEDLVGSNAEPGDCAHLARPAPVRGFRGSARGLSERESGRPITLGMSLRSCVLSQLVTAWRMTRVASSLQASREVNATD